MNSKTRIVHIVVASFVAIITGALSQIANTPPSLQDQLPQLFPEHYRGIIGLGLKVVMGAATGYTALVAANPAAFAALQNLSPAEPAAKDQPPTTTPPK